MAPIYKRGYILQSKEGPQECCGKRPMQGAWKNFISPAQAAHKLRTSPDVFGACGVYAGARSGGVVVLDVDERLGLLEKAHGEDLKGPRVDSPKRNAAKFFFHVPEQHWNSIEGVTLKRSNAGWEILWTGKQAIVCGDYKEGGEYTPSGDFSNLPEIPMWMLGAMQEAHAERAPMETFAKKKGPMFRSREYSLDIIQSCLRVVPDLGAQSRQEWVEIGFMVHDELPCELGLQAFTEWSRRDPHYADEWEAVDAGRAPDPCAAFWKSIKPNKEGGIGLGSLIRMADFHDPKRTRFPQGSPAAKALAEMESAPITVRQARLAFEDVISRGKQIMEGDNTAQMNYDLHHLALDAGLRDRQSLEQLLVDQMSTESMGDVQPVVDIEAVQTDYIIPDVIPTPSHILVYGAGGDGKSSSCWVLAKHIAEGIPFMVRGQHVPVQQGKVLILNGDQPLHLLKEQLVEAGLNSRNVLAVNNWNLQSYARFRRLIEKIRPKLVIIDSLIGCSGGRAFDENKSDFATPLYWLTRNNGTTFPATTIMMIHHANKTGGFRGTSAIRDAVDETWALKRPTKEQVDKGTLTPYSRLITIEKSRSGRGGTSLIMQQEKDLSFSLSDFTPEVDPANTAPSSITDRVLQRMRAIYPRTMTRAELNADQLVGGNTAAIRKSVQRLLKRCLIEVESEVPNEGGGKPTQHYKAVLSRGEGGYVCPIGEEVSDCSTSATGQAMGHQPSEADPSHSALSKGTPIDNPGACPIAEASSAQEKGPMGRPTGDIGDAFNFWDQKDAAGALAAAAKAAEDYQANKPVTLEAQVMTVDEGLEAIADEKTIDVEAKSDNVTTD